MSAGLSNSRQLIPQVNLTGVAINHDGRAATITAPNGTAQQRVLRTALAERQTMGEDRGAGRTSWHFGRMERRMFQLICKKTCLYNTEAIEKRGDEG